jgi:flagellar hook-length control protein FliK
MKAWTLLVVGTSASFALLSVGCQKKEEPPQAAPSATAAPAVSIAPIKEPEPAASQAAAPTTSGVASAEASAAPAGSAAPTATTAEAPKKPVPSGSVQACCSALDAAAKKPGKYQNRYTSAASVCAGLEKALKAGKANLAATKVTLTAQLHGAPAPGGC